jgi:anthranilate synthase component 2
MEIIRPLGPKIPLLGVCLGHQAIGQVYGGTVLRARHIMHGKTSLITHDGSGVFKELPVPFTATRYHSLVVAPDSLPSVLQVNAWTDEDDARVIMGMRHQTHPVHGVQFHPEAILTEHGHALLRNFLEMDT